MIGRMLFDGENERGIVRSNAGGSAGGSAFKKEFGENLSWSTVKNRSFEALLAEYCNI